MNDRLVKVYGQRFIKPSAIQKLYVTSCPKEEAESISDLSDFCRYCVVGVLDGGQDCRVTEPVEDKEDAWQELLKWGKEHGIIEDV